MTAPLPFLVPEVVQTSTMDCGPACLKSLLHGKGIRVSYGRLREACQTDVDGTSIDTIETVAVQLGLHAEQVIVPTDHVLLPESDCLPAIAVVVLPDGATHFVVIWSVWRNWVQVMDPGSGRRWLSAEALRAELYEHHMEVGAADWRAYAGSEGFVQGIRRRMQTAGLSPSQCNALLEGVLSDPHWRPLAALDAATRMTQAVIDSGGLKPGAASGDVLARLSEQACQQNGEQAVPLGYWAASVGSNDETVRVRGAVLVRASDSVEAIPPDEIEPMCAELEAALNEAPSQPGRALLEFLREDGVLAPGSIAAALVVGAAAVMVEAVLLRGILDIGADLVTPLQRALAVGVTLFFFTASIALELSVAHGLRRLGRGLEARMRVAFLEKIPRLGDRYFQSRLNSDMAERSHAIHAVRNLPSLGATLLQTSGLLVFTTLGIIIIDPWAAPFALLAALAGVVFPLLAEPILSERDLRVRNHGGALSRFYLDALLGLVPIRAHGAALAVRSEHEGLLVEWARAGLRRQRATVGVEGLSALFGFLFAALILVTHLALGGAIGSVLLLVYWALNLPSLGAQLALVVRQYPAQRNVTLRLLEPLGALDAAPAIDVPSENPMVAPPAISFQNVSVVAGGHQILEDVSLDIPAQQHIAVVGASGAGKSSLVGLLLGWHRATEGQILIDEQVLDDASVASLRRHTAWVDPAVQLWNRSLLDNLHYGSDGRARAVDEAIETADLMGVLQSLADGMQTPLGEGGALLSGGEGQRVRLGRALIRKDVKLVILDEPFRGLEREKRTQLLQAARQLWRGATLICITHDVNQTLAFDRVLVIEKGRLVEDGTPEELRASATRFQELFQAERALSEGMWQGETWQRVRMRAGRTVAEGQPS